MAQLNMNRVRVERDIKEDRQSIERIDRFIYRLLIFAIVVIPLLIGIKTEVFVSPIISSTGVDGTAYQSDIFTYFKFVVLIVITLGTTVPFLYKLLFLNYEINKSKLTPTIYLFMVAIILSTIFAEYKHIALWGVYNRHDGAITYICFSLLMLVAINIQYPKNILKTILVALYPFVWINLIISLLTFYGKNILTNKVFQSVLTIFDSSKQPFNEGSILTGTLNQWNYMSGISGITIMIFLAIAIFEKSNKLRIINILTALAAFATLLVSISTSGFLAFVVMSIFMLVLLFLKDNWKKGLITFAIFFVLASGVLTILAQKNSGIWNESIGTFVKYNPFESKSAALNLNLLDSKAYASDKVFSLPELPEQATGAGSGRLYIWGTMLELMKDKPLTGYGLDTVLFHFPQNELEKRSQLYWDWILVDKPHSFYLGILWGTGILGFIGFVGILIILSINIIKGLFRLREINPYYIALSMGFGAFLIQALFNDSVIGLTVAPLIIGAVLYANNQNEQEEGST
ncbi:O-antigen ligase family protein [Psychrobacillus sp. FSL K6-1415]|uniref:O-antigen ligase family protein n=1 Tax=Psychrobacillus sp. FSL K6-1415 TaxID=2921544 RepID=UPI0030FA8FDD